MEFTVEVVKQKNETTAQAEVTILTFQNYLVKAGQTRTVAVGGAKLDQSNFYSIFAAPANGTTGQITVTEFGWKNRENAHPLYMVTLQNQGDEDLQVRLKLLKVS
jgi:hypothetical protein